MGSFSIWHWLVVLVIVMLVFGTKKVSNIGSDLGKAVKGFKENIKAEALEEACTHASNREQLATKAERDSIKYMQVKFMEDKIDQYF